MFCTAARRGCGQLHVAGGAGELHGGDDVLRDAGGAHRVALGLEPAGDVDGQLAVLEDPAFLERAGALAGFGQAHGLVHEQFGDGEAVVDFGEVQVLEPDACHRQGALPGHPGGFEGRGVAAFGREEVVGLAEPGEPHRRGGARPWGRWTARRRRRRRRRGSSRCGAGDRRPWGSCPRRCGRTPRRGPCGAGRRGCPRRCGGSSRRWCPGRHPGSRSP